MRKVYLAIIILVGAIAIDIKIPTIQLISFYALLALSPIVIIILKKNLVNGLLLWFFFGMFTEMGRFKVALLPAFSPGRLIIIILFFLFLIELIFKQREISFDNMKIEAAMFTFSTFCLFSMIIAGNIYSEDGGIVLGILLKAYMIPFSIFFLAKNLITNEKEIKKVFIFFAIMGCYLGITGIFEHFQLKQFVFPSYIMHPMKGIHFGRVRGPFLNAGVDGLVMNMVVSITIFLVLQSKKKLTKYLLFISTIIISLSVIFTYTRAVWIGFIVLLMIFTKYCKEIRKVLLVAFFMSIVLIFVNLSINEFAPQIGNDIGDRRVIKEGGREITVENRATNIHTIESRIILIKTMGAIFLDKPLLGLGFDTFQQKFEEYMYKIEGADKVEFKGQKIPSHNAFLVVLAETGLIGFSLVCYIIFSIFRTSQKLYHQLPSEGFIGKSLIVMFWGVFFSFIIKLQFAEMRYFMFPSAFFFGMSGIIAGLYQRILLNDKLPKGTSY